jgi:hypothetical protein
MSPDERASIRTRLADLDTALDPALLRTFLQKRLGVPDLRQATYKNFRNELTEVEDILNMLKKDWLI